MLKPNSVNLERKSSMHTIRANFGIYLNIRQGCIYVVGGDTGPCSQTYKTEAYCLLTDRWTNLPNIGDIRAGMGLCMLNDQYLYSFGGYSKHVDSGRGRWTSFDPGRYHFYHQGVY